jgi:di/tricarboxylate transporter
MPTEIIVVLTILVFTVILLALDLLRIDLVGMLCMLALAWTGVLDPSTSLSGFSSNAVIAMMAVMVLGRGIARTGITDHFAQMVLRIAGEHHARLIALVSAAVGLLSGIIQNVGAAALFLPAMLAISRRKQLPASQIIMPIGFAAILGGTLTMVGSGPLILTNDLLANAGLGPYGLFAVTPVGLALLATGIGYFFFLGKYVLPQGESEEEHTLTQKALIEAWQLPLSIWHYRIPEESTIVGRTPEETDIWDACNLNIVGITRDGAVDYAPWRETRFEANQDLAILGEEEHVRAFVAQYGLTHIAKPGRFAVLNDPNVAGFAEVVIPPRSSLVDQSIRQFGLRRRYAVEPVILYHEGRRVTSDFSDLPIAAGDIFVVYGLWEKIQELKSGEDFVLLTQVNVDRRDQSKAWIAVLCFAGAVGLALTGFPIATAFFSGAVAMILTGVLRIEEAYEAVDWKIVFFLAGLIPLGLAMQQTGTAALLAESVMTLVAGHHTLLLLLAVAVMSTAFSLFMSNVASTVILAPLVISMAEIGGVDPRPLALLVAVCAANSFLLPTHQVNALLKTPGGYQNTDYLKAGGGMTLLFLVIAVAVFYLFYL